jgi:hypothetical protein
MPVKSQVNPGAEVLLRFEGNFEASDAGRVHEALASASPEGPVVLDFTQVRHFEDFAIALIAPDLMAPGRPRVRLRGLGLHQERLLEYFGVQRGRGGESAATSPRSVDDLVKARA